MRLCEHWNFQIGVTYKSKLRQNLDIEPAVGIVRKVKRANDLTLGF